MRVCNAKKSCARLGTTTSYQYKFKKFGASGKLLRFNVVRSHGLVVKADGSQPRGCKFESRHTFDSVPFPRFE